MPRPPRVDRAAIARAASELGLEQVTMRGVADRLGVSVGGLYHHVAGREDLVRLAAEHTVLRHDVPVDRGQPWTEWLAEWARYNRQAFLEQPALLAQYVEGGISRDAIAETAEAIYAVLVRQGFTLDEARRAYDLVSGYAVGSAVAALRHGRTPPVHPPVDFEAQLEVLLRALAAER